ncbi:MAG: hypothetical protein HY547_00255 [Elusimicrobia bacterium]|nr:hypothetical protein [Elusimicrobiota bacterium]
MSKQWQLAAVMLGTFVVLPLRSHALTFRGFGNADFVESSKPGNSGGFIQGTVDLFLTDSINERIDILAETTVHPHKTGLAGIDLERLQAGYLFNDGLRLWVGRFHNLLGYWNLAYHHGLILHTSVDRPEFLKWEHDGGFLPTHFNGLWAEGRVPAGPLKLHYGLMAGNGPQITTSGMQTNNVGDDNTDKAVSFNVTAKPRTHPFSGFGFSGYRSNITERTAASVVLTQTRQMIIGAHLFHAQAPVEFIAEYYRVADQGVGVSEATGTQTSAAYFVQVGYNFREKFMPYYRYEEVRAAEESSYVMALRRNSVTQNFVTGVLPTSAQDHARHIVGVRYNLDVRSALKAEGRYYEVPGGATAGEQIYREVAFQWAFSF